MRTLARPAAGTLHVVRLAAFLSTLAVSGCDGSASPGAPASRVSQTNTVLRSHIDDVVDGIAFDTIPDIDGDGIQDLAVGSPFVASGTLERAGGVRVLGSNTWTEIARSTGDRAGGALGMFVAGARDGRAVVYAGAPEVLADSPGTGRVLVLDARTGSSRVLQPNVACSRFGTSASPVPDSNGDGVEDLIVVGFEYAGEHAKRDGILLVSGSDGTCLRRIQAPAAGAGQPNVVTTTKRMTVPGRTDEITVVSAPTFSRFYVVETSGPELVIAHGVCGPGWSGFGGQLGIVSTRVRGMDRVLTFGVGLPSLGTLDTVECPQIKGDCHALPPMDSEGQLGTAVTTCPDLDGDGLDDLVAGAPGLPSRQGYFGVEGLGVDDKLRDKIRDTRGYVLFVSSSTGKVLSKVEGPERGFGKALAVLRSDREPSQFLLCVGSGTCRRPSMQVFRGSTSVLVFQRTLD